MSKSVTPKSKYTRSGKKDIDDEMNIVAQLALMPTVFALPCFTLIMLSAFAACIRCSIFNLLKGYFSVVPVRLCICKCIAAV